MHESRRSSAGRASMGFGGGLAMRESRFAGAMALGASPGQGDDATADEVSTGNDDTGARGER
jgi:hypothetical protein